MIVIPYKIVNQSSQNVSVYKCYNLHTFDNQTLFISSFQNIKLNLPYNLIIDSKSLKSETIKPKSIEVINSSHIENFTKIQMDHLYDLSFKNYISKLNFHNLPKSFFDNFIFNPNLYEPFFSSKYNHFLSQIVEPYFESFLEFNEISSLSLEILRSALSDYSSLKRTLLTNNPYFFSLFLNKSFEWVKNIIEIAGLADDNEEQELAALVVSISTELSRKSNSMFTDVHEVKDLIKYRYNLSYSNEEFRSILADFSKRKWLKYNKKLNVVSSYFYFYIENSLKNYLVSYSKLNEDRPLIEDIDKFLGFVKSTYDLELSEKQRDVLEDLGKFKLTVISGKAGTGKSTVCRIIEEALVAKGKEFYFLSTTGRAAKSLHSKLEKTDQVSTIHSFLGYNGKTFSCLNKAFDLNYSKEPYFIIDEFGMCDSYLAYVFFKTIPKDSKIILIGDPYQLPPVSPGNPMSAFLEINSVHQIVLDVVYRQSKNSDIFITSNNVLENKAIKEIQGSNSFKLLQCNESHKILDNIKKCALNYSTNNKDFCILSPVKEGTLGIKNLNKEIKNIINPLENKVKFFKTPDYKISINDRVMFTVNSTSGNISYCNGDLGYVKEISNDKITILLENGFNKKIILTHKEAYSRIILSYAMTVHKSQGCEFDNVIVVLNSAPSHMLSLNLVYTAITRAKLKLIVFANNATIMNVSKAKFTNSEYLKKSWLYYLLKVGGN